MIRLIVLTGAKLGRMHLVELQNDDQKEGFERALEVMGDGEFAIVQESKLESDIRDVVALGLNERGVRRVRKLFSGDAG